MRLCFSDNKRAALPSNQLTVLKFYVPNAVVKREIGMPIQKVPLVETLTGTMQNVMSNR